MSVASHSHHSHRIHVANVSDMNVGHDRDRVKLWCTILITRTLVTGHPEKGRRPVYWFFLPSKRTGFIRTNFTDPRESEVSILSPKLANIRYNSGGHDAEYRCARRNCIYRPDPERVVPVVWIGYATARSCSRATKSGLPLHLDQPLA